MLNKQIEEFRKFQKRTLILGIGKSLFSLLIVSKLYYLQILNKSKFGKLSETNRIKIRILYPERGIITDNNGKKLAENRIDYQITILKEDKQYLKQTLQGLGKIITFSKNEVDLLEKNLKKRSLDDFVIVKRNLTWSELEIFEYYSHNFPYFSINKQKVRDYKNSQAFSHVIGYVGFSPKKKDSKLNELKIGKSGVEEKYNTILQGKEGIQKVESNSSGKVISLLDAKSSIPGKNLDTYLDKEIQEFCFNVLDGKSGSSVIIDNETGGVVSLVSSPSFDINEFSYGINNRKWNLLKNNEMKPLLNKSIAGLYSPGSTFKLIVALLALEDKNFQPSLKFFCNGHLSLGNHKFHCWKRKGHGLVDLNEAIYKSCDCYFYNLANQINMNDLSKFANLFTIGEKTGIDLPNEQQGIMPNEDWKIKKKGENWHLGETYNAVIGQGFTLSTPLQIAVMTSRIATGKLIIPSILKVKQEFETLPINEENLNYIRDSMYKVVNKFGGTAFSSKLKTKKIFMAGKTATSQVRRISLSERETGVLENEELPYKLRDHSIFSGFAPFDDPKYSIAIVLEHHGSGSKYAAPMARDILDFALS